LLIALTVTVPKPVYPESAEMVCCDSVGVIVLFWLFIVDAKLASAVAYADTSYVPLPVIWIVPVGTI
jgi:hypothetical protein